MVWEGDVRKLAAVVGLTLVTSACMAAEPMTVAAPVIHGYGYNIYGSYSSYDFTYGYAHPPPRVYPARYRHHRHPHTMRHAQHPDATAPGS